MADADLVLEGGGVKGAGLVGAISSLASHDDPYTFHRVAGTSAGAIVASMLCAGMSPAEMKTAMTDLDFSQFEDESRAFRHFSRFGEGFGLLFQEGIYKGDFMRTWISSLLSSKGVRTWGDLKQNDPDSSLPPAQRYKLVVIVSDVSQGRMLRLPWDYASLGVDADHQEVADAVRASASIPFFFRPFHMKVDPSANGGYDEIACTDGGMLSDYPIDIFDRTDGKNARWPTLGIKLSAESTAVGSWSPDADCLELAKALISTMENAHDRIHINNPFYSSRTIFVDTTGYKATDFHLLPTDKEKLFTSGVDAGVKFLGTWDWNKWKAEYDQS